jgi:hypothetical protein
MLINENPVASSSNVSSFFDKIVYFLEFALMIIIGFGAFSFILFYIGGKMEGAGMIVFVIWLFCVLCFNGTAAPLVYKDVKRLQVKGVNFGNMSPLKWSIIVFVYPLVGLSWYLANRRANYKKQVINQ